MSFGTVRVFFKGICSIDFATESEKFEDEILINLWTENPIKIEERVHKRYNRIQIALPRNEAKKLFKDAIEKELLEAKK